MADTVRVKLGYGNTDRAWKIGQSIDEVHKNANVDVEGKEVTITYPNTAEGRLLAQGITNAAREEGSLIEVNP
ncbi:hypothetical protein KAR91_42320 [Candidatus Pacearchaeota archaeon]|nr:hypothetical protein [Candidatus Pacearchaeota archaeon]